MWGSDREWWVSIGGDARLPRAREARELRGRRELLGRRGPLQPPAQLAQHAPPHAQGQRAGHHVLVTTSPTLRPLSRVTTAGANGAGNCGYLHSESKGLCTSCIRCQLVKEDDPCTWQYCQHDDCLVFL